jgi:hypothetical protein
MSATRAYSSNAAITLMVKAVQTRRRRPDLALH